MDVGLVVGGTTVVVGLVVGLVVVGALVVVLVVVGALVVVLVVVLMVVGGGFAEVVVGASRIHWQPCCKSMASNPGTGELSRGLIDGQKEASVRLMNDLLGVIELAESQRLGKVLVNHCGNLAITSECLRLGLASGVRKRRGNWVTSFLKDTDTGLGKLGDSEAIKGNPAPSTDGLSAHALPEYCGH